MSGTQPSPAPQRSLLRVITCGSVDDGKSTLIGRLLYESKSLYEDQLQALAADSRKSGTQGGALDFALLVDGLVAEREQGITIDVAYRYFSSPTRKFILADTPGHLQYTRNMATAASNAGAAMVLVDARKGVLTQTRRHAYIAALLGIRALALVVNKMDLVDYREDRFAEIEAEFSALAQHMGLPAPVCIPMSALRGDNLVERSPQTPWYQGPTLGQWLEDTEVDEAVAARQPLRFPVQWVNRPSEDFRGLAGTVASGSVHVGDAVVVQPSAQLARVKRIVTYDGDLPAATAGQSVTLVLDAEIDVSRGDLIADPASPAEVADRIEADMVWFSETPLFPGRGYWLKCGPRTVGATVTRIVHRVDIETFDRLPADQLDMNAVGLVELTLDQPIAFDAYDVNRDAGGFLLIDRIDNETSGAGMLVRALRDADNLVWHHTQVSKAQRAAIKHQKGCVLWLTGLSGAGKSTIANVVEQQLHRRGCHSFLLDGDNVRHGLNKDLGFTDADRVENIRRVGEVARLMVDAGLIVLVAFISPFRAERRAARALLEAGEFLEVFIDAPLELAEQRDPKGLYRKARSGALKNFTGIDSPYEPPEQPDIHIQTAHMSPDQAADCIVSRLITAGLVVPPSAARTPATA